MPLHRNSLKFTELIPSFIEEQIFEFSHKIDRWFSWQ